MRFFNLLSAYRLEKIIKSDEFLSSESEFSSLSLELFDFLVFLPAMGFWKIVTHAMELFIVDFYFHKTFSFSEFFQIMINIIFPII